MTMSKSDTYQFFITLKDPEASYDRWKKGQICHMKQREYMSKLASGVQPTVVIVCTEGKSGMVKVDALEPLTPTQAGLLLAVTDDRERLERCQDRDGLEFAVNLSLGSPVRVLEDGEWCEGTVRYIGPITEGNKSDPMNATFFGIELKGKHRGKGKHEGSYLGKKFFHCERDCAVFAPYTRLRAAHTSPEPVDMYGAAADEPLSPGDRVTFFCEEESRSGMVLALEKEEDRTFVLISTDLTNEKNGNTERMPIECVIKEELMSPGPRHDRHAPAFPSVSQPDALSVGSVVQVELSAGRIVYGTLRWIGKLPDMQGTRAGIELDTNEGVSDGTFKGIRFFECPPKRGLFVKLSSVKPDSRFPRQSGEGKSACDSLEPVIMPPLKSEQVQQILMGNMKGIQGHCNSCYMDTALFSLFSCSLALDSLLFKSTDHRDVPIQSILLHDIVNPLRSEGFVPKTNVMKLRKKLQENGHCGTFTTHEKDPEEFLTLIMQHVLHLEPLLKLSTGKKVQECYCYQIFLDHNHSLVLPTVQQLLEHSFHSNSLRLAEVPSCLILQMPRFGKKFKMFDKIVPSLELDISDLLLDSPQECVLCGSLASLECVQCFRDSTFGTIGFKQFCATCSQQVHSHPQRVSHHPCKLHLPEGYSPHFKPPREKLRLFAVLCIETSHYVCFVRHGPSSEDWIFFDSMADRQGYEDGYNIPRVLPSPEVARYLDMPLGELAAQNPREMEGVAKRLFCDAYLYLYESPTMQLYR